MDLRVRISIWNECFHGRDSHFSYALCTKTWIFQTEAIIIPWKIRIVLSERLPFGRGITAVLNIGVIGHDTEI